MTTCYAFIILNIRSRWRACTSFWIHIIIKTIWTWMACARGTIPESSIYTSNAFSIWYMWKIWRALAFSSESVVYLCLWAWNTISSIPKPWCEASYAYSILLIRLKCWTFTKSCNRIVIKGIWACYASLICCVVMGVSWASRANSIIKNWRISGAVLASLIIIIIKL